MKRSLVWSACLVFALLLYADTAGPNFAGTAVNEPDTTQDWLTPGNGTTSNDSRATVGLADIGDPDIDTSDLLKATNFSFSLPAGGIVDGIECEVEVSSVTDASNDILDSAVVLVLAGTPLSITKPNVTDWTASDVFLNHGSSTDLWARTWTVSEVNAPGFGCALSAQVIGDASGGTGRVDSFRITVTFTSELKPLKRLPMVSQTRYGRTVEWSR